MQNRILTLAFALALMPPISAGANATGDAAHGKSLYRQCRACHLPAQNSVGPKHCGVVGRVAASVPDYNYSPAMKKSGITWTPDELDRFLDHPSATVPGNYMPFAGMHDPQDRADLITYLASLLCP
ncbi:MAG: cytochrome c family protein [Parvibaculum sp.]|nr:cytochrome c family protein [Parvibaculum sp.]|tara:strand:- start:17565 stop:17942 length:378 start_codon:yes stop_codon:yes gene_type:complete